jgi:outer membrane protein assembly factor BamB
MSGVADFEFLGAAMMKSCKYAALARAGLGAVIAAAFQPCVAFASDWLQFGFDPAHSGYNPQESAIATDLNGLQLVFAAPLPAKSEGAPAFAENVSTADGVHDMVFVTTIEGHIVAIDAHGGYRIWMQQPALGPAPATFSSPAIDPGKSFVYSAGLDGKVHKYSISDGTEILDSGWPQIVTAKPEIEKISSALSFATAGDGNTYLYATTSNSNNDQGDYQGHIVAIDLGSGVRNVFNAVCSNGQVLYAALPATPSCSNNQGGIWGRPGVAYDVAADRIFVSTGNGAYTGNVGGFEWGESVIALTPSLLAKSGQPEQMPLDTYTPPEYETLNAGDIDLGQTTLAIVPAPAGSKLAHLAVQLGKDGILRLLNADDMSGHGGPGHTGGDLQQVSGLNFLPFFSSQPAVWVDPATGVPWVFAVNNGAAYGFFLTADSQGHPGLVQAWSKTDFGGSSAVVADGLLFYAEQSFNLVAVDAKTGTKVWSSPTSWAHWASPIVVNDMIFLADGDSTLRAYALPVHAQLFNRLARRPLR